MALVWLKTGASLVCLTILANGEDRRLTKGRIYCGYVEKQSAGKVILQNLFQTKASEPGHRSAIRLKHARSHGQ